MRYNKAFTLVELAIVIVIIGLLVGGVLAGKELVEQAKIRSQIKQFQEYDAATATFMGKYGFLPADVPFARSQELGFSSSNINGQTGANGDGRISDLNGRTPPQYAWVESKYYFIQLRESKILKGNINAAFAGQFFAVGVEFPPDMLGKGGIAAISLADGLYYYMGPTVRVNASNNSDWNYISENPTVTPAQAFGIDQKLDDGIPGNGKVRPIQLSATASVIFTNDIAANNCITASGDYNLNSDATTCRLVVRSVIR